MKYFLKAIFNVNLEFFIWLETNKTSLNVSSVPRQLHLQELNTDGVKDWGLSCSAFFWERRHISKLYQLNHNSELLSINLLRRLLLAEFQLVYWEEWWCSCSHSTDGKLQKPLLMGMGEELRQLSTEQSVSNGGVWLDRHISHSCACNQGCHAWIHSF